jgi:hypothetical protein
MTDKSPFVLSLHLRHWKMCKHHPPCTKPIWYILRTCTTTTWSHSIKTFFFVFESTSLHGRLVGQLKEPLISHMQTFPHVSEKNPLLLYGGGKARSHGPPLIFGPAPLGDHHPQGNGHNIREGPGDQEQAIPRAFPYNYVHSHLMLTQC